MIAKTGGSVINSLIFNFIHLLLTLVRHSKIVVIVILNKSYSIKVEVTFLYINMVSDLLKEEKYHVQYKKDQKFLLFIAFHHVRNETERKKTNKTVDIK